MIKTQQQVEKLRTLQESVDAFNSTLVNKTDNIASAIAVIEEYLDKPDPIGIFDSKTGNLTLSNVDVIIK